MKKQVSVSASSSSSSILDNVASLLSKFFNKLIDSLFSDDSYDKKTDDKVSDATRKEAEKARKQQGGTSTSASNADENGEPAESADVVTVEESIEATPRNGAEGSDDLDPFLVEQIQWPDTKDWFIKVTNKKTGKSTSKYLKKPSKSQIQKAIESLKSEVTASKRIKVSLNRIVGETEDTINITAIKCSYGIDSAYSDIKSVLDDDEFINTVPEGDSAYEILPTEDDFVVDEYDGEVDSSDIYVDAFDCATSFYSCLFYLHINKSYFGTEFASIVESLKYSAQYHMDTIAKWAKMHNKSAEITLCYCLDCCDTECPSAWMILETALSDYKNCLDALYCCATHEEQSVIDSWLLDIDYALYNVNNATL